MQEFPHHYQVTATAGEQGLVRNQSSGIADLDAAPPSEFGGPGDQWSPETLLVAAVADCFVLSFRAVARASRMAWRDLQCQCEGTLERVDRVTRFTHFVNRVTLTLPADGDVDKAQRLLHKSEQVCLITNSLSAQTSLEINIVRAED